MVSSSDCVHGSIRFPSTSQIYSEQIIYLADSHLVVNRFFKILNNLDICSFYCPQVSFTPTLSCVRLYIPSLHVRFKLYLNYFSTFDKTSSSLNNRTEPSELTRSHRNQILLFLLSFFPFEPDCSGSRTRSQFTANIMEKET